MVKFKFQIDDRVKIIESDSMLRTVSKLVGKEGTVIDVDMKIADDWWVTIRFNEKISNGHDCDGNCEDGYGYWLPVINVQLLQSNDIDYMEMLE